MLQEVLQHANLHFVWHVVLQHTNLHLLRHDIVRLVGGLLVLQHTDRHILQVFLQCRLRIGLFEQLRHTQPRRAPLRLPDDQLPNVLQGR